MVKRVRRLLSGQCEIARICGEVRDQQHAGQLEPHTPAMTTALWTEWQNSAKLTPLYNAMGTRPDLPVDDAVAAICEVKNLSTSSQCVPNLRACVEDIKNVNHVIATVHERSQEHFDSNNAQHENALEKLWQLLQPGQSREGGRYSKQWGQIGFQQSDPASDFRGAGVLALDQLVHLAANRNAVACCMLVEPSVEMSRYPWACVGINLTREVVRLLDARVLHPRLFGKAPDAALGVVHDVYADIFEILHQRWLHAKPDNVLAFPAVLKDTMQFVDKELATTGVLVPPPAHA